MTVFWYEGHRIVLHETPFKDFTYLCSCGRSGHAASLSYRFALETSQRHVTERKPRAVGIEF